MTTQTAFRLESETLKRLKQLAKDDGRTMTWHVEKALKAYFGESEPKKISSKNRETSTFKKPTQQEVSEYCLSRGGIIDGNRFYDYCEANGWKLSNGNKMKDWKAAVRTWEGRKNEQRQNRESLVERTERKAKEKITTIEAASNAMDTDGDALWLQVDQS